MSLNRPILIATRGSALALAQSRQVQTHLQAAFPGERFELEVIRTTGDALQTSALSASEPLPKGLFTKELEVALLERRADLAVHSLKDLPTQSADGLVLACVPERAPRCDALLLPSGTATPNTLHDLPQAARIGTGSPRRQAQLLHHRPDLQLSEIRGNVDTRLRKLDEGQYDAIILAEAGLGRLGLAERISLILSPPLIFPAVSQGALGIEAREADTTTRDLLAQLICPTAMAEVLAERSLLRTLRAGCHAPLGVWCCIQEQQLSLTGVLLSHDGNTRLEQSATGDIADAESIGCKVADLLLSCGAEPLLQG